MERGGGDIHLHPAPGRALRCCCVDNKERARELMHARVHRTLPSFLAITPDPWGLSAPHFQMKESKDSEQRYINVRFRCTTC